MRNLHELGQKSKIPTMGNLHELGQKSKNPTLPGHVNICAGKVNIFSNPQIDINLSKISPAETSLADC